MQPANSAPNLQPADPGGAQARPYGYTVVFITPM
jgi:hypothetical protein